MQVLSAFAYAESHEVVVNPDNLDGWAVVSLEQAHQTMHSLDSDEVEKSLGLPL